MSKTVIMNVTLNLLNEKQVEEITKISEIKYLEDNFYLLLKETE